MALIIDQLQFTYWLWPFSIAMFDSVAGMISSELFQEISECFNKALSDVKIKCYCQRFGNGELPHFSRVVNYEIILPDWLVIYREPTYWK